MAGIVSATKVQIETAYRALRAAELELRFYNQGSEQPGTTVAARATAVNALVVAAVAALAPLNT
ncbi:hypothetical protein PssvBMR6_gp54 [Pseudomonas phage MR6]|uniref:Uncharacterized protein n=1 Tax=Pseudomonas phage MR5 TaxID=2711172 RepID=A0A6M3TCR7_9CAUD|nr:hypothetical protein PssvBMR5_gp54 [Pseudomonas phage MR5]QJD54882.1 hypothetical protein PssvBMR6_gp54 [Pseudomonas phage MR6]QJD54943.1 hypothetical protein PssvBMR7_gp56 [Pseudomonas phage MR7]QJD55000.1 putative Rz-like protein [Pseudomonas phage MR8]QJD55057.1 putative Rz-like protein [Pseudomonas phage MR12]QJD55360.1 hypothetical protein PssvBMR18_gp52 [Pseudomonas phage MR18]QJF74624.1 hypothetical protein PssvBMR16_gp55 [Pseudomonas phage MR16]